MRESLRFTHIKLSNWKNFARCDVALAERVHAAVLLAVPKS